MGVMKLFELASRMDRVGVAVTRVGLIVVLLWIGGLKAFRYEADGIVPFVANSPLLSRGLRADERPGFLGRAGRRRGRHRAAHCRAAALAPGYRPRQQSGCSSRP